MRKNIRLLAAAGPQRLITLTLMPEAWSERRLLMLHMRQELTVRRGFENEWAWFSELTQSALHHVHALQKGSYIPQAVLQTVNRSHIVDIRAIKGERGATAYAMKEALQVASYGVKGNLEEHLDLNGGRLYHTSRGYFGMPKREFAKSLKSENDHEWMIRRQGGV